MGTDGAADDLTGIGALEGRGVPPNHHAAWLVALAGLAACQPEPTPDCDDVTAALGTAPALAPAGFDLATFAPLSDGDALRLDFGPQGGVHVWAGAQLRCAPDEPTGAFWLTDGTGRVVAGSKTLIVPLPVVMDCVADGTTTTCSGQQVVFVVPNPEPGDPAWFGPTFTLGFTSPDAEDEVSVVLTDPRSP